MNKDERTAISFELFDVFFACRVTLIRGERWYVLKDICGNLDVADHKSVRKNIPEKSVKKMDALIGSKTGGEHSRDVWYIRESAVIEHFMLTSHHLLKDKPKIKKYQSIIVEHIMKLRNEMLT